MKTAVVLFNLGGPDRPEAIRPFLSNLFSDPAILDLPRPLRGLLAAVLARRREKEARRIYDVIGGRSPLNAETGKQARALEARLGSGRRVFVAMRYWHPLIEETVREVAAWGPDRIVLLPLYPQFSTVTTGSSLREWRRRAAARGLRAPTAAVCCYPRQPGFVEAYAALVEAALRQAGPRPVRVLFSAHGLPRRVVAAGDPYAWQVSCSAAAVAARLARPGLDWRVCYQSNVGPLRWTGPATRDEIVRAGAEGKGAVVVPIAFVSEHSETLVELDIDYAALAEEAGCAPYLRVAAPGTLAPFVEALAALAERAGRDAPVPAGWSGSRLCPADRRLCPMAGPGAAP